MSNVSPSLTRFKILILSFLGGTKTPSSFKVEYMKLWRSCRDSGELSDLNALSAGAFDRIFTALDGYCEEIELRDDGDLDERQLFDAVAATLPDIDPGSVTK